ncbi:MAG: hypothetical protein M3044_22995, partial [Thermoproteota archaeon]|nr:hypothetical protein [Thermoproteota archaeon]
VIEFWRPFISCVTIPTSMLASLIWINRKSSMPFNYERMNYRLGIFCFEDRCMLRIPRVHDDAINYLGSNN